MSLPILVNKQEYLAKTADYEVVRNWMS